MHSTRKKPLLEVHFNYILVLCVFWLKKLIISDFRTQWHNCDCLMEEEYGFVFNYKVF